jgi:hypothetical protein
MTHLTKSDQLIRGKTPDRPLESANDWWGLGYLAGIGVFREQGVVYRWYCGQAGAYEQFKQGNRAGRAL